MMDDKAGGRERAIDDLARGIASKTLSRRGAVKLTAGAAIAVAAGAVPQFAFGRSSAAAMKFHCPTDCSHDVCGTAHNPDQFCDKNHFCVCAEPVGAHGHSHNHCECVLECCPKEKKDVVLCDAHDSHCPSGYICVSSHCCGFSFCAITCKTAYKQGNPRYCKKPGPTGRSGPTGAVAGPAAPAGVTGPVGGASGWGSF